MLCVGFEKVLRVAFETSGNTYTYKKTFANYLDKGFLYLTATRKDSSESGESKKLRLLKN